MGEGSPPIDQASSSVSRNENQMISEQVAEFDKYEHHQQAPFEKSYLNVPNTIIHERSEAAITDEDPNENGLSVNEESLSR